MINEAMIQEWREQNDEGNGIGAGDGGARVFDADEAVEIIKAEYPQMEIIETRENDGAQVLCKDGDDYILFLDAGGMWGCAVTVE